MLLSILKHQRKVHGQRLLANYLVKNNLILILFIFLTNCNTVTGTVEGTVRGVAKDAKTIHHYTTCIFTDTQCGDLDLD